MKNLNSFRFLHKALTYEIERQIEDRGRGAGRFKQETRLWDSKEQRTYGMRSKEFAHDYRYFPEPDLLPLVISEEWKVAGAGSRCRNCLTPAASALSRSMPYRNMTPAN